MISFPLNKWMNKKKKRAGEGEGEGESNELVACMYFLVFFVSFFKAVTRRTWKYIFVILRLAARKQTSHRLWHAQEKVEKMCMKCGNRDGKRKKLEDRQEKSRSEREIERARIYQNLNRLAHDDGYY